MVYLRTGVLAGILLSKLRLIDGEFRNWLGENGNGFIGVTPGDSKGLMPGIYEQFPNVDWFEIFWNCSFTKVIDVTYL